MSMSVGRHSNVFDEEDVKRHKEIDKEAGELISSGRFEEGMVHLMTQDALGTHFPVFVSENPEIQMYDLRVKMAQDHSRWLEVVTPVGEWFKGYAGKSA